MGIGSVGGIFFFLVFASAFVDLALTVWAIVKLAKTPQDQLSMPFVAWILIILLVPFGAIAFLVAGVQAPRTLPAPATAASNPWPSR